MYPVLSAEEEVQVSLVNAQECTTAQHACMHACMPSLTCLKHRSFKSPSLDYILGRHAACRGLASQVPSQTTSQARPVDGLSTTANWLADLTAS